MNKKQDRMVKISQPEAVQRAEAFLSAHHPDHEHGGLQGVRHSPADEAGQGSSGIYYVMFAYVGPPVHENFIPPLDHPTVVLVDDETGNCAMMVWL